MERKKSHRLPNNALKDLEESFKENPYPANETLIHLADKHNLGIDKVKNWFNNRKSKEKRMQDQLYADQLRQVQVPPELFSVHIGFRDDHINLLECDDLNWKVFLGMRSRIFQLQTVLAKVTVNEELVEEQDHFANTRAVKSIFSEISNELHMVSDYSLDRQINIQVDCNFAEVFSMFSDVHEVGSVLHTAKNIDFTLEGEHLESSYFTKKMSDIGRLFATVKLDSLSFNNQLETTKMVVQLRKLRVHFFNDLRTLELSVDVILRPLNFQ